MSCNGCRVLRKGCSESCILRPCLEWIENPEAQGHATIFVSKFFGRAGLMSFLSSVPDAQRPAMFRSLLFEACGRTINPVTGAVGLLWSRNWHMCQTAVETVFRGGVLQPMSQISEQVEELRGDNTCSDFQPLMNGTGSKKHKTIVADGEGMVIHRPGTPSTMNSDESVMTTSCCFEGDSCDQRHRGKLLNLFV